MYVRFETPEAEAAAAAACLAASCRPPVLSSDALSGRDIETPLAVELQLIQASGAPPSASSPSGQIRLRTPAGHVARAVLGAEDPLGDSRTIEPGPAATPILDPPAHDAPPLKGDFTVDSAAAAGGVDDDGSCAVCLDRAADAVLLECGHGGLCVACALAILRHDNLPGRPGGRRCPICRAPVLAVVRVEEHTPHGTRVSMVPPDSDIRTTHTIIPPTAAPSSVPPAAADAARLEPEPRPQPAPAPPEGAGGSAAPGMLAAPPTAASHGVIAFTATGGATAVGNVPDGQGQGTASADGTGPYAV